MPRNIVKPFLILLAVVTVATAVAAICYLWRRTQNAGVTDEKQALEAARRELKSPSLPAVSSLLGDTKVASVRPLYCGRHPANSSWYVVGAIINGDEQHLWELAIDGATGRAVAAEKLNTISPKEAEAIAVKALAEPEFPYIKKILPSGGKATIRNVRLTSDTHIWIVGATVEGVEGEWGIFLNLEGAVVDAARILP